MSQTVTELKLRVRMPVDEDAITFFCFFFDTVCKPHAPIKGFQSFPNLHNL